MKNKDSANTTPNIKIIKRKMEAISPLKYQLVQDRRVDLSKTRAFAFLELPTFKGERAVREGHVQYLYDEWSSGRFLWHNVIIAAAELDGITYRINGQHTCWMRVQMEGTDDSKPHEVAERIYKVKDNDQLRALYSAFDRNAPRTVGHISAVMLMDTDAARDIPPAYLRTVVPGFKMWWFDTKWQRQAGESGHRSVNEVIEVIKRDYPALFNAVGQFVREMYDMTIVVRRSPVIGAMFATFEKGVGKAIEFWKPVFDGLGLEDTHDPRWILRDFLNSHSLSIIKGGKKIGQEGMYRVCINAWNAWRQGEKISHFRTPSIDSPRPKVRV